MAATSGTPARLSYDLAALAEALGVSRRRAKAVMDRLPQEHLDRMGLDGQGARMAPLWLLRRELAAFRDGPDEAAS